MSTFLVPNRIILLLPWMVFIILSCSQTEGGGSGGLGPDEFPYLIEGVLCSDISEDQKPVAIADNFPIGEKIFIWIHWENIKGTHEVEVFWYDPDGELQHNESFTITTKNERYINWFFLKTTPNAKIGEWVVAVYLDGEFIRSYVFDLFQSGL